MKEYITSISIVGVVVDRILHLHLQATQLIRAVSTLLDFTPQEEQFVKEYFDYKVGLPQKIFNPPPQFSRLGIQVSLAIYVCLSGLWLGGLLHLSLLLIS